MLCAMATTKARPGDEEALVTAANDHARALREQPGCQATYVLLERGSSTQVSISVFDSDASFQRALEATRPVIAKHHIERFAETPPVFQVFDVR
jgi:heme-degrading monooxygenase HmoA